MTAVEAAKIAIEAQEQSVEDVLAQIERLAKIGKRMTFTEIPLTQEQFAELSHLGYQITWSEANSTHQIHW